MVALVKLNQSNLYLSAGSLALSALALPLLSREFLPSEYGPWVVKLIAALSLGYIIILRLDRSMSIARSPEESLTIALLASVIASIILLPFLLVYGLTSSLRNQSFIELLVLTYLSGLSYLAFALSNRLMRIKTGILSQSISSTGSIFISVAIHQLTSSEYSFFYGYSMGILISTFVCLSSLINNSFEFNIFLSLQNKKSYLDLIIRNRRFPLYFTPMTILSLLRDRMVYIALTITGSISAIGIFNIAMRIINLPNNIFAGVLRPKIIEKMLSPDVEDEEIKFTLIRFSIYLLTIMSTFCATLIVLGDFLVIKVLGESWSETSLIITITCFVGVSQLMVGWIDRLIDFKLQHRFALILEIGTLIAASFVILQATYWSLSSNIVIFEISLIVLFYNLATLIKIFSLFKIGMKIFSLTFYFAVLFVLQILFFGLVKELYSPLIGSLISIIILAGFSKKGHWVFVENGILRQ
jgi:O-antigen/teichoic acid export membrane protein